MLRMKNGKYGYFWLIISTPQKGVNYGKTKNAAKDSKLYFIFIKYILFEQFSPVTLLILKYSQVYLLVTSSNQLKPNCNFTSILLV